MTISHSSILVLLAFFCMNCGCVPSQIQETTSDQADLDKQNESPTIDYGQSPTPESLISTFRDWHLADQLKDAAERDKMMASIYVNHDDVKTIFKDQAKRLQTIIDLQVELEKQRNVDRSQRLVIKTIEAVDVRKILNREFDTPDGDGLESISELFPANAPVYILRIRWEQPMGGQSMGPFFFLNGRWTYVPDPGDMFEVAIKNVSQDEIDSHEKEQRRWIKQAKERAAKTANEKADTNNSGSKAEHK